MNVKLAKRRLDAGAALAGRRDYRRNARILALAVAGFNSGEIARAVGGSLTARSIDGLLLRVRRYVAAHALDAAAGLYLDRLLQPPGALGKAFLAAASRATPVTGL